MSNPNSLLLLADHIKLSLLEQQRAKALNLARDPQDGHIARSLDQFREGIESLEKEYQRLQEAGDESKASALGDTLASLKTQYSDLSSQFHGFISAETSATLTSPNDPSLAADFAHAQSSSPAPTTAANAFHQEAAATASQHPTSSTGQQQQQQQPTKKAVRFSTPTSDLEAQHHQAPLTGSGGGGGLFPYRDDPSAVDDDDTAGYREAIEGAGLSNAQIHAYHARILAEQDSQLDALGESIARQRELSLRIGDELDSQVLLLDESERAADRHAGALGRARRHVGRIARGAASGSESRQMGAIVVLIIVLVLLIVILK